MHPERHIALSSRKIYPFYFISDLLFLSLSFWLPYVFNYGLAQEFLKQETNLPYLQEHCLIYTLWAMILLLALNRGNFYTTDRSLSIPKEIFRVCLVVFHTSILIAGVIFFSGYKFFSPVLLLENIFLLCIFLAGWRAVKRAILRKLIAQGFNNINVLIIGAGKVGKSIINEIRRNPHWGFNPIGFLDDKKTEKEEGLPILGTLNNFLAVAKKYFVDEVIISIPSERVVLSEIIRQSQKINLGLRIIPDSFEERIPHIEMTYLGLIPLLTYKERRHHPAEFALKRLFDVVASVVLLILLFTPFLIIGLLIKLDSPGPVFYIRKRSGFKGKVFNFYKFRSMVAGSDELKAALLDKNESQGNIIFKMKKDPRVTRMGRFLRRFSLDELPQIFNVLKGDMSLVGPRPFPVEESEKFQYQHMERLTVRPGITGLAQIKGRSDLSVYRWVKWDIWYVNNWSFWLDLLILWWTPPVVLKGKGAY